MGNQDSKSNSIDDGTSRTSSMEPNIQHTDLRNRLVPSAGTQIDPSAIVRNGNTAATINITASVCAWGHSIQQGISNAVSRVKAMFADAVERIKAMDLRELLRAAIDMIKTKSRQVTKWCKENSRTATFILIAVIATIFGAAAPSILAAIEFSAAGPIAGSMAAAWQAGIGNVVAGSLFAIFQSAAMGGYGLLAVSLGGVGIGAALGTGIVALVRWYMNNGEDDEDGAGAGAGGENGGGGGDEVANVSKGRNLLKED